MRYLGSIATSLILISLIFLLNKKWGATPPLGKLLSPTHGYLEDPELCSMPDKMTIDLFGLSKKVQVYFDERMVPHVFAESDNDAFYVQGYLHAKDRLWQMEFQTHFAAGRISEIVGAKAMPLDKANRRLGITYSAEIGLREMEKDTTSINAMDAYTAGVNAYINSLSEKDYPIEYKLLDYKPEAWSNLKTSLLTKYMAKDLAAYDDDFEKTAVLATMGKEVFDLMYPNREDSLDPIIPKDLRPPFSKGFPISKMDTTSAYFHPDMPDPIVTDKPDKDNGSNNWALDGTKTATGKPILCNDPHLKLGLPSIWYEIQLTTPTNSCYGVSLPGSPGIVIGFNQDIAFGSTNAMRDVLDYYKITYKDRSHDHYLYNGKYVPTTKRVEKFIIKGANTQIDTVVYTHFGPVIYDDNWRGLRGGKPRANQSTYYAVRWKAHDASNDLLPFLRLMKAKNYDDYRDAIASFSCPGQNLIFASKSGDIAITQQGTFPAKWKYQGEFLMDGKDSTYEWQGMIPAEQMLTMKNPKRGFVSSANQLPTDPIGYPYYLGGDYIYERGYRINSILRGLHKATVQDMMNLQNDNFNTRAHQILPLIFETLDSMSLSGEEKEWLKLLKNWDKLNDAESEGATIYQTLMDSLEYNIWGDELKKSVIGLMPEHNTIVQDLMKNKNFKCVDNIFTPQKETFADQLKTSFVSILPALNQMKKENKLKWGLHKGTCIPHLIDVKQNMTSLSRLELNVGGGEGIVNATKKSHGPSWKMIISLTDTIEAYGVYPGGQSGHPGSPYYDTGVSTWAAGEYFKLWFMRADEAASKRILRAITFEP